MTILIWFCLDCDRTPFLSQVPVCPHCLGSHVSILTDDEGTPLTTASQLGREAALAMKFDDSILTLVTEQKHLPTDLT